MENAPVLAPFVPALCPLSTADCPPAHLDTASTPSYDHVMP
jgi:hypothetical protein